jgi:hypothetical protein
VLQSQKEVTRWSPGSLSPSIHLLKIEVACFERCFMVGSALGSKNSLRENWNAGNSSAQLSKEHRYQLEEGGR